MRESHLSFGERFDRAMTWPVNVWKLYRYIRAGRGRYHASRRQALRIAHDHFTLWVWGFAELPWR